jgi:hypothetical protein
MKLTGKQMAVALRRLKWLPGAERLDDAAALLEYYRVLDRCWPHELDRAVSEVAASPTTTFFPPPGRLLESVQSHRRGLNLHSYDALEAHLQAEANRLAPPEVEALPSPALAEQEAQRLFSAHPELAQWPLGQKTSQKALESQRAARGLTGRPREEA